MDTILIKRQLCRTALHAENVKQICDLLGNPAGHIGLDAVVNLLFQAVFIMHPPINGKENIVDTQHPVVLQKFLAEQCFVNLLPVKPDRVFRGRNHRFAHAASPPFSACPVVPPVL